MTDEHNETDSRSGSTPKQMPDPLAEYGKSYFDFYGGTPYVRGDQWQSFFGNIADRIVRDIAPKTVLDVGCAKGFLVEALRDRGVEAYGFDISRYALEEVRADIKPYVWQGLIEDPLPSGFDLTVCIEIVEHLPEVQAARAIRNLTRSSDDILFSSTPEDYEEVTHKNVRPLEYWAALFAENGFFRDLEFDALFVAWHATRFRKRTDPVHRLIIPYERKFAQERRESHTLRQLATRQRNEISQLKKQIEDSEKRSAEQSEHIDQPERHVGKLENQIDELERHARQRGSEITSADQLSQEARAERDRVLQEWGALNATASWRMVQLWWRWRDRLLPPNSTRRRLLAWPGRVFVGLVRGLTSGPGSSSATPESDSISGAQQKERTGYERWILENEPTTQALANQVSISHAFQSRPLISVITPIYNPDPDHLSRAIQSVIEQTYDHWELCLVDACDAGHAASKVAAEAASSEARIKVKLLPENLGISGNSNEALAMASGSYLAFLDHDDTLAPFALFEVVKCLNENPEADLLYSDHDILTEGNRRSSPLFKPSWSPEILLSANYITHLTVTRKQLVDQASGFDASMDGAQDWDLFLRIVETADRVEHIPKVLYHWRDAPGSTVINIGKKSYAPQAQLKAIQAHLRRTSREGSVEFERSGFLRAYWPVRGSSKVSIIIPTRDQVSLLRRCIDSILAKTRYENFEILLVDTGSVEDATRTYYRELEGEQRVEMLYLDGPFNYSRANNFGAEHGTGDLLLFLNNDVEALEEGWLEELVRWAELEDVGAVGAKLLYPDRTIQHAGVVIGLAGYAGHVFSGAREGISTPFGYPEWYRNYTAVTGACLMMRRDVLQQVGGFDEAFQLNGSDVELCQRVELGGRRIVYTPFARLIHHEGKTHRGRTPPEDFLTSFKHYEEILRSGDRFYSPNLSLGDTVPRIKPPGEPPAMEFVENHLRALDNQASQEDAGTQATSAAQPALENAPEKPLGWLSRSALRWLRRTFGGNGDLWARYSEDAISLASWFDFSVAELEQSHQLQEEHRDFREIQSLAWFLPEFRYAYFGGVYTILRFAAHLKEKHGISNRFVIMGRMDAGEAEREISTAFPELSVQPVSAIRSVSDVKKLPQSDAAIASLWSTAYAVLKYNRTRRKFYFIQDFEPLFYPAGSTYAQAEATYQFGFFGLTNTVTLKDVYEEDYGGLAESFKPAVDLSVFHRNGDTRAAEGPFKVFFYGRPRHPRNAFELGAQALRILKKRYRDQVKIVSAGDGWDPSQYGLEGVIDNLGRLPYQATGDLYRSCHAGLVMMFTRHPSYLPLEMMASGCLVVTNFNPHTAWLLQDGQNCLLTIPSATALADRIDTGLKDEEMRKRITENAARQMREGFSDWGAQIDKIYQFMRDPWGGSG